MADPRAPFWTYQSVRTRRQNDRQRFLDTTSAALDQASSEDPAGMIRAREALDTLGETERDRQAQDRQRLSVGTRAQRILEERKRQQQPGGIGAFLGSAADTAGDVLGGVLEGFGRVHQAGIALTTPPDPGTGLRPAGFRQVGQRVVDALQGEQPDYQSDPAGLRRLIPGESGAEEAISRVAEEVVDPTNLLVAAKGPALAGRLARGGRVSRALGAIVEPAVSAERSVAQRLAGEAAMSFTAREAGEAASAALPEGTPDPVRTGVTVAAGLAGGAAVGSGLTVASRAKRILDARMEAEAARSAAGPVETSTRGALPAPGQETARVMFGRHVIDREAGIDRHIAPVSGGSFFTPEELVAEATALGLDEVPSVYAITGEGAAATAARRNLEVRITEAYGVRDAEGQPIAVPSRGRRAAGPDLGDAGRPAPLAGDLKRVAAEGVAEGERRYMALAAERVFGKYDDAELARIAADPEKVRFEVTNGMNQTAMFSNARIAKGMFDHLPQLVLDTRRAALDVPAAAIDTATVQRSDIPEPAATTAPRSEVADPVQVPTIGSQPEATGSALPDRMVRYDSLPGRSRRRAVRAAYEAGEMNYRSSTGEFVMGPYGGKSANDVYDSFKRGGGRPANESAAKSTADRAIAAENAIPYMRQAEYMRRAEEAGVKVPKGLANRLFKGDPKAVEDFEARIARAVKQKTPTAIADPVAAASTIGDLTRRLEAATTPVERQAVIAEERAFRATLPDDVRTIINRVEQTYAGEREHPEVARALGIEPDEAGAAPPAAEAIDTAPGTVVEPAPVTRIGEVGAEPTLAEATGTEQLDAALEDLGGTEPPAGGTPPPDGGTPGDPGGSPEPPKRGTGALDAAIARVEGDLLRPGRMGEALLRNPIIREGAVLVNPSLGQDRALHVAHNARVRLQAALQTRWGLQYHGAADRVLAAWQAEPPRYLGDEAYPGAGTPWDAAQRPGQYDLSPEVRAALDEWQALNDEVLRTRIEGFNSDTRPWTPAEAGAVYMPTVDINADLLSEMGMSEVQAASRGRGGTRVYENGYERWKQHQGDEHPFVPQTDLHVLAEGLTRDAASEAGMEAFKRASGGKTLVELSEELHPHLRTAREQYASLLSTLRGRLETAERAASRYEGIASLRGERTRLEKRLDDLNPRRAELLDAGEYGPELSYLSGEAREIDLRIRALDRVSKRAAAKGVERGALVEGLREAARDTQQRLTRLRRLYDAQDLRPYERNQRTGLYYEAAQARAVDKILGPAPTDGMYAVADEVRAWVLGVDASIGTLHGSLAAFMDAPTSLPKVVGDMFANARDPESVRRFVAEHPELAEDFAFDTGHRLGEGGGAEFRPREGATGQVRGPERIPGLGDRIRDFNEGAWRAIEMRLVNAYANDRAILEADGLPREVAGYEAAHTLNQIVPRLLPADTGRSAERSARERLMFISPSFFYAPSLMVKDAASALAKLGLAQGDTKRAWAGLLPRERTSLLRMKNLAGTVMTISASTAFASALLEGDDPIEAVKQVADPRSGRFASLVIPGVGSVGIGGPLRSLVRALVPRSGSPDRYFGQLGQYLKGRQAPLIGTALDQYAGKDYFGRDFVNDGVFESQVANRLWYLVENLTPLSAGSALEGVRSGASGKEIAVGLAGNLTGANLYQRRALDELDASARARWGKDFRALEPSQKATLKTGMPGVYDRYVKAGSERFQAAEATKERLRGQQLVSDTALLRGDSKREAWVTDYRARQEQLRGALAQAYGDKPLTEADVKDPLDRYVLIMQQHEGPDGRLSDDEWDQVDAAMAKLPKADQDYIARNTGVDRTPVARVYRQMASVRSAYYNLPQYRGFTADEGRGINDLWQEARNLAPSADRGPMLAALNRVGAGADKRVVRGVRRRILGTLREDTRRERFTKQHPELRMFYGRGPLTAPEQRALVALAQREAHPGEPATARRTGTVRR